MAPRRSLRGRGAFDTLFASGRRAHGSLVRCLFALGTESPGTIEVGFAVPKRLGNAVKRNRARRLMREAYRREEGMFAATLQSAHRSARVVFVFKAPDAPLGLARVHFADVHRDMTKLVEAILTAVRASS